MLYYLSLACENKEEHKLFFKKKKNSRKTIQSKKFIFRNNKNKHVSHPESGEEMRGLKKLDKREMELYKASWVKVNYYKSSYNLIDTSSRLHLKPTKMENDRRGYHSSWVALQASQLQKYVTIAWYW